jgi:hypothetical protein
MKASEAHASQVITPPPSGSRFSRRPPHGDPPFRIGQEAFQGACQRRRLARRNKLARAAGKHNARNVADPRRDGRDAAHRGLEDGERKALGQGRERENIQRVVHRRHVFATA